MINYPNTNRLFITLLIIASGLDVVYGLPAVIYLVLYLLYSALFFYGVFCIDAHFFVCSVCSKEAADGNEIAISFDDGPSDYTPEILQILNERGIKASFFCVGKQIESRAAVFQQIHRQGHLIGNHSYCHHLLFDFFSGNAMLDDLQRMDTVAEKLIGKRPGLFRPPFGVTVPWLARAVSKGGYISVGWSVRSKDTAINDESRLLAKVMKGLQPGAVYLFHDTSKTTLAILPEFIERATAGGYRIVRLDKMLNLTAYR